MLLILSPRSGISASPVLTRVKVGQVDSCAYAAPAANPCEGG